jgi:hypothetical protein
MQAEYVEDEWASAAEAARVLGIPPKNIRRLASQGFLTARRLPGCDARYLLSDVRRLAESATAPARPYRQGELPFSTETKADPGVAHSSSRTGGELR